MKDEIQKYLDECIQKRKNPEPPTMDEINGYLADFMESRNNLPHEEFEGYSPHEMAFILNRTFEEGSPLELRSMDAADCRQIPLFRQVNYLLETVAVGKGIKLTANGNLPRSVVSEMYALGAPEDFIEKGITKLRNEEDSISVQMAHGMAKIIGAIKVRSNTLLPTKKGEKFLSDKQELACALVRAVCCEYHPGYFDLMRAERTGQLGVGFTLILLNKYGLEKRPDLFYSDKYFKAYPDLLDEGEGLHCYSLRMFDRMLYHLGIIAKEEENAYFPDSRKYIEKTPLFDKMIHCHPPRFVFKPGKS